MNKKKYLEMRNALVNEAEQLLQNGDVEGFEAKEAEVKTLDEKFENISKAQANLSALKGVATVSAGAGEMVNPVNMISNVEEVRVAVIEDPHNTVEYRHAFMNFCKTGVMDAKFSNADTYTGTTDAGAVIPTTILQEVIKKAEVYGQIFKRIRRTNIKGGVDVPISSLKPTASWIGEAAVSDRQKATLSTKVSFSYYGLECKIAISLLADVTTLDIFEKTVVDLISEAMVKAMDIAIVKGTGTGQPTGLTVDTRIPTANKITLGSTDFVTWSGWKKKVFAKIPLAYRAGGSFIMAAGTFEGYIDGMTDDNGQPIGRTNAGIASGPQERFSGREVLLVEDDVITPYDSAATGDVVAIFVKLSDYCVNSNLTMQMFRWFDHDTNQYVDKAILIADGKILDPNGVIIVKKGA